MMKRVYMFNNLFEKKDRLHSGSDSYRYVERLIRNEKRILIVSPYIDEYYARLLLKDNHKQIFVISSSADVRARRILTSDRRNRWLLAASAPLALYGIIEYIGKEYAYAVTALLLSFIILSVFFLRKKPRNISFRVPEKFVHAKMYIGRNEAISGSANLTYRGMHSNVEQIGITIDKKDIRDLEAQFWNIWKKSRDPKGF